MPKRKASSSTAAATRQGRIPKLSGGSPSVVNPPPTNKKNKGFALRNLSAVLTGISTLGINRSADGSMFALPLERAPLNIPSHATNLTASLVKFTYINDYQPRSALPNPIFVETSFTYGGVNPRGDISQILAMVPHEKQTGYINYETGTPIRVPCNTVLKGNNPQHVEFRLVDANGNPIIANQEWSLQILIEWEQEVQLDYLRTSIVESQYY